MMALRASSMRMSHPDLASPRHRLEVGDLLAGKYRVERVIGEGGMGLVVEAHHELLDQRVAVKLLYHDIANDEAQSRLVLEARAAAKLRSEHVARVIDVDVGPDGLPFIVMELLEGADLAQISDRAGPLPAAVVVDYMLQALEGLAHAHAREIVHRDLKPSNLFLCAPPDGSQILKILDFGISKSPTPADRKERALTGRLTVLGSPPYMSPEQVRNPKSVDHRTDIWALGVCMYELLTNEMPFDGDEVGETFSAIIERQPRPIRSLVAGVSAAFEAVVMRCLAKRPGDRYADVGELAAALVPFGSGAWSQSPARIDGTLSSVFLEEASGMRVRAMTSVQRIALARGEVRPAPPPRPTSSVVPAAIAARGRWLFPMIMALCGVSFLSVAAARRAWWASADALEIDRCVDAVGIVEPPASAPALPSAVPPVVESPQAARPVTKPKGGEKTAGRTSAGSRRGATGKALPAGLPLSRSGI